MAAGTYDASRRRCQNSGCHGTRDWDGDDDDDDRRAGGGPGGGGR
jgi:hypothetical protein